MTGDRADTTLRPVTPDDREFLLEAYAASRETELALVPWDAAMKRQFVEHQFDAQSRHYEEHYPGAVHSIIEVNGQAVGRLYLDAGKEQMSILDFVITAKHRRAGIGGHILKNLTREAAAMGITIGGFIEEFNPFVGWFFKRGFSVVQKDGFMLQIEYGKTPHEA